MYAYVKMTNNKGCFLTLAPGIDGRVKLVNLSTGYVDNPAKAFPPVNISHIELNACNYLVLG